MLTIRLSNHHHFLIWKIIVVFFFSNSPDSPQVNITLDGERVKESRENNRERQKYKKLCMLELE